MRNDRKLKLAALTDITVKLPRKNYTKNGGREAPCVAWPNDGEVEVRDREKHILDISKIPRQAGSKKVEAKAIKKII